MRWMIVGASGMLGSDLASVLVNENLKILTKTDCDITSADSVHNAIQNVDVVINCAAYTAVDVAEDNEEVAFAVNSEGPKNLAKACKNIGAKLVQISTDYVFDGTSRVPYSEDSTTNPKSIYGESKLAGELAVTRFLPDNYLVIRTAWLYGENGNHFGKTILKLAEKNESLKIVNDQFGQPTWTRDLAQKIVELVTKEVPNGIYHGTSSGAVSWFDFAKEIFKAAGLESSRLEPVSSEQFKRPAPRPSYSVLGHAKFKENNIAPIRHWQEAFQEAYRNGVFSV